MLPFREVVQRQQHLGDGQAMLPKQFGVSGHQPTLAQRGQNLPGRYIGNIGDTLGFRKGMAARGDGAGSHQQHLGGFVAHQMRDLRNQIGHDGAVQVHAGFPARQYTGTGFHHDPPVNRSRVGVTAFLRHKGVARSLVRVRKSIETRRLTVSELYHAVASGLDCRICQRSGCTPRIDFGKALPRSYSGLNSRRPGA